MKDDNIDTYFSEEEGILKKGVLFFIRFHTDSHHTTLTPGLGLSTISHMVYANPLYVLSEHDPAYIEGILSYRWPWFHRRMMRHYFGNCRDIALRRLAATRGFNRAGEAAYDGSFFLGRLIGLGANARFLRPALGALIAKFVMLELIVEEV